MKLRKNQTGSGVIEVVLILVLVGIIGFTGWFVWHSQKETTKTQDETNKVAESLGKTVGTDPTAVATKQADYLVIKEWGVKFDLTGEKDSFLYALGGGAQSEVAHLGTANTEKLGDYCVVAESGVGGISRYKQVLSGDVGSRPTPLNNERPIAGYYYYYSHPQADCTDGTQSKIVIEQAAMEAVQRIVSSIQSE